MLKHTFLLLLHEPAERVKDLIDTLLGSGSSVVVHYDAKSKVNPASDFSDLLARYPGSLFFCSDRVKVEWGAWSIMQATVIALKEMQRRKLSPEYVTLLSGSCIPTKNLSDYYHFLQSNRGKQFIECHDVSESQWVIGGLEKERWQYRYYFNWRTSKLRFALSFHLQKMFCKPRNLPDGFKPYMGSQWWTLTWDCLEKFVKYDAKVRGFYKTTLIPDEFYLQTFVANSEFSVDVVSQSLTYS